MNKPMRFSVVDGVPSTIALKYRTGKRVQSRFGDDQMYYQLADGRNAYFPLEVGVLIDELHLGPQELPV